MLIRRRCSDWHQDDIGTAAFKDIPRLIRRTRIQVAEGRKEDQTLRVVHERATLEKEPDVFKVLSHAIMAVMPHFSSTESVNEVASRIEAITSASRGGDGPDATLSPTQGDEYIVVEEIFNAIAQVSPQTVAVFKPLHQGIVLTGKEALATSVMANVMSKDVRTQDGWQLDIILSAEGTQITHTRAEEGLDGRWRMRWSLSQIASNSPPRSVGLEHNAAEGNEGSSGDIGRVTATQLQIIRFERLRVDGNGWAESQIPTGDQANGGGVVYDADVQDSQDGSMLENVLVPGLIVA